LINKIFQDWKLGSPLFSADLQNRFAECTVLLQLHL